MSETFLPVQLLPYIKSHKIGRLDIDCITVKLTPEEWALCDKISGDMWANSKSGSGYNRGLINTADDKHFAERVGKIGEVALSKITGLVVDTKYRDKGDDYDFIVNDLKIDIKTSSKCPSYKQMLITGEMRGKPFELKSDIYVAAYLAYENKIEQKATVVIVGWCTREEAIKGGLQRGKKGSYYKNYEVHYRDLHPISELLTMINPEIDTVTVKPEEVENV